MTLFSSNWIIYYYIIVPIPLVQAVRFLNSAKQKPHTLCKYHQSSEHLQNCFLWKMAPNSQCFTNIFKTTGIKHY